MTRVWLKYVWRAWQQQPAPQNKKCTQFLSSVIDCSWSFRASWDEIKWLLHKTMSNIDDISLPWPLNELPHSLRLFDECFYCLFCCCWSSWKELGLVLSQSANQIAVRGPPHHSSQIRDVHFIMLLFFWQFNDITHFVAFGDYFCCETIPW